VAAKRHSEGTHGMNELILSALTRNTCSIFTQKQVFRPRTANLNRSR